MRTLLPILLLAACNGGGGTCDRDATCEALVATAFYLDEATCLDDFEAARAALRSCAGLAAPAGG